MPDVLNPPFTGDYSRSMFDEAKRYLGFLQQQGKPVIDADLIDQAHISAYAVLRALSTAFPSGTVGDAFKVIAHPSVASRVNNFALLSRRELGKAAFAVDPESFVRYYVRGLPAQLTNSTLVTEDPINGFDGRDHSELVGTTETLGELFHRSSALIDGLLTDANARFIPGELVGFRLYPNAQSAVSFEITANTATTITVTVPTPGDMIAISAPGDFYRIEPSTPAAEAYDVVWLDCFIGEMTAEEDPDLTHGLGGGVESSRRLVLRQQVRYSRLQPSAVATADAAGVVLLVDSNGDPVRLVRSVFVESLLQDQDWVYLDSTNNLHYATPLAVLRRPALTADIGPAVIFDFRERNFGSSREVVAARGDFPTLGDRMASVDLDLINRKSVLRDGSVYNRHATHLNCVQLVGNIYVGESPTDAVGEVVKLFTANARGFLKANPASLVSSRDLSAGVTFGLSEALTLYFDEAEGAGSGPYTTTILPGVYTLAAIAAQIDAVITAVGYAIVVQGKYLAIVSKDGTYNSAVRVDVGVSPAYATLFDPAADLYVTNGTREPRVRKFWADTSFATNVTGGAAGTPKFAVNPVVEFDAVLPTTPFFAQFGLQTAFTAERADAGSRRGIWEAPWGEDQRLDLEHYSDGQHRNDAIKDRHLDWGYGPSQIGADDIPVASYGDVVATTALQFLQALADGKYPRSGVLPMTGPVDFGGYKGINAADPVNPLDVVNFRTLQQTIVGIIMLEAARVATTGNLSATYAPGPKTLTATSNGAIVIDTVALILNDVVLVKNQTNPVHNGLYYVTQVGDGSNPYILTRTASLDGDESVTTGSFVYVAAGATHAYQTWVLSTQGNPVIGTDANNWTQFSSAANLSAGDGLVLAGPVLNVGTQTDNPVRVDADSVYLDTSRLVDEANSGLEAVNANKDIRIAAAAWVTGGGITGGGGAQSYVVRANLINALAGLKVTGSGASAQIEVSLRAALPGLAFSGSGELYVNPITTAYAPGANPDWLTNSAPATLVIPTTTQEALDYLAKNRSLKTHDHSAGVEPQIPTGGIADEAVTGRKIPTPYSDSNAGAAATLAAANVSVDDFWQRAAGHILQSHRSEGYPGQVSGVLTTWNQLYSAYASPPYGGYVFKSGNLSGQNHWFLFGSPNTTRNPFATGTENILPWIWLRILGDLTLDNSSLEVQWSPVSGTQFDPVGPTKPSRVNWDATVNQEFGNWWMYPGRKGLDATSSGQGGGGGGGGSLWGFGGAGGTGTSGGTGGGGGSRTYNVLNGGYQKTNINMQRTLLAACMSGPAKLMNMMWMVGAGGMPGGRGGSNEADSTYAHGGAGGGVIILEIGGKLTLTGTSYFSVRGGDGENGGTRRGGGGGGSGGLLAVFANRGIEAPTLGSYAFRAGGGNGGQATGAAPCGGGGGGGGGGILTYLTPNGHPDWGIAAGGAPGNSAGAGDGGAGGPGTESVRIGIPALVY